MAQWIPKTAWKVSNLNKRYGQSYVTSSNKGDHGAELDAYAALHSQSLMGKDETQEKLRALIAGSGQEDRARNPFPGAFLIDLRDAAERRQQPLGSSQFVAAVHPHDLISGAIEPILPADRSAAELFLLASAPQRAINGSAALRRMGYSKVHIIDYEAAKSSLAVQ